MDARQRIEAALAAGPTEGPWGFAFNEQCSAGTNHEPLAYWISGFGPRQIHYDKCTFIQHIDARYIEAAQPTNIREVLQTLASKEAELVRLREAATAVLSHRAGDLPNRGWLIDNDASRKALFELARTLTPQPPKD